MLHNVFFNYKEIIERYGPVYNVLWEFQGFIAELQYKNRK